MAEPTRQGFVVVVWGDSIAAGNATHQWPALAELTCQLVINEGYPVRIINQGAGGKPAALARNEFETRILPHKPDLVILQFGFNDIRWDGSRVGRPISTLNEFEAHMRGMIHRCRTEARARVLVFGNHRARLRLRLPNGQDYDAARIEYNQAARRAAEAEGAPFHDLSEELQLPDARWIDYVCEDGVHLSPLGFFAYARCAAGLIMKAAREASANPQSP